MGEYAKYNGKEIKIGTCEDMYYLRYDQRNLVRPLPGNLDPRDKNIQDIIRFRFPWPDEDNSEPGGQGADFDPFRSFPIHDVAAPEDVDHTTVQFKASNGYLVSLPCPEGPKKIDGLTIHKNGYGGAVHLVQNRVKNGKLVPVFKCGGCGCMWRVEDEDDLAPYLAALESRIGKQGPNSFWRAILERMKIQPA